MEEGKNPGDVGKLMNALFPYFLLLYLRKFCQIFLINPFYKHKTCKHIEAEKKLSIF